LCKYAQMMEAPPNYWLPRPEVRWSGDVEEVLERLYKGAVVPGAGGWLEAPLPVPKWVFLCWLADAKGLLLHGSGNRDIAVFEPRQPNDDSPDDFSKQRAVFAAGDGIWPTFYAVLDRERYPLRMLNGALRFELPSGELSDMRYFFSVTGEVLRQQPWREGVVYILPREGFRQGPPPYGLGGWRVHEPHWANPEPVRPLAKLRVRPTDFPFLERVRGHDDVQVMARAKANPYGFPWLDER